MRVVWLDGALRSGEVVLPIDDPAVRWGEGLFETMRAEHGRVALLDRHLDRVVRSAAVLGLEPVPGREAMAAAVGEAVGAAGGGPARVRLTVSPRPTLLVEITPEEPLAMEPAAVSGRTVPGAWSPGDRMAEHKTLSYAGHRWSQRRAVAAGADHALLLDARGRLGEAAVASVFCAVDGAIVTAPATGLLPGVARAAVIAALAVREEALAAPAWQACQEIVLTNAVRGAMALTVLDGRPVGDGAPGPVARAIHTVLRDALGARRGDDS